MIIITFLSTLILDNSLNGFYHFSEKGSSLDWSKEFYTKSPILIIIKKVLIL